MSQGVYVLGGKCPEGKCPGGKCPGGICPWGKCPGGTCPGGLCPRTNIFITCTNRNLPLCIGNPQICVGHYTDSKHQFALVLFVISLQPTFRGNSEGK